MKSEVKMLIAQTCPTLCDPMDCRLPRLSVHGIFQAKILEWVAISFSRGGIGPTYLAFPAVSLPLSHLGSHPVVLKMSGFWN